MYNLTFYKKALQLHKHVGQSYKNWVIFHLKIKRKTIEDIKIEWFIYALLVLFRVNYVDCNSQILINIIQRNVNVFWGKY